MTDRQTVLTKLEELMAEASALLGSTSEMDPSSDVYALLFHQVLGVQKSVRIAINHDTVTTLMMEQDREEGEGFLFLSPRDRVHKPVSSEEPLSVMV